MSNTALRPGSVRRLVSSTVLGTTIEFFDVYIYGLAAGLYFGQLFFPGANATIGMIASFATLAVGFLVRPIGGVIGGHFGDRYGRKKVLVASMMIMGASTFLVGVLPSYEAIGILAPILLIVARIAQGLGAGAEYGGGVLMLVEHMGKDRRGFWGSIANTGIWIGISIGTLFFAGLTRLPEDIQMWAWRAPFIASAVLVLVGLWIRLGVSETPVFVKAEQQAKASKRERLPLVDLFRNNKKAMVCAIFVATGTASFQLYTTFATSYAKEIDLDVSTILLFHFLNGLFAIALTLFFGWLSDRTGRRPLVVIGSILVVPMLYLMFWAINQGNLPLILLTLLVLEIGHSMIYGPMGAFFAESFATRARYTGVSIAYQVGGGAVSGLGPLIAASLLAQAGGPPHVYTVPLIVVVTGALATIGVLWAPDRTGQPLIEDEDCEEPSESEPLSSEARS
ncbi:MFS transporter [Rhodococcus koreensis]|uniref:MFS transporter n=1 Tax=Rhodococcus koreensis TaxID=99653 RepID=UPI003672C08A